MRVGAIWKRWIEVLATLYLSWRESGRERRSLIVTRENEHVVVRRAEPSRDAMLRDAQAGTVLATLTPGTEVSADVRRAADNSFVVLEFPDDKVFVQRITVPAQARKFLAGVIRNQIERLSPWPANDVVYGFAAEADAGAVRPVGEGRAARPDRTGGGRAGRGREGHAPRPPSPAGGGASSHSITGRGGRRRHPPV